MIITAEKLEDMKFRAFLLETIEYFLKTGRTELAKQAGEISSNLKRRIEKHV